jgi:hypothetical protein
MSWGGAIQEGKGYGGRGLDGTHKTHRTDGTPAFAGAGLGAG